VIDRALKSEEVVITRHGRLGLKVPSEDAGTFVGRMRDEDQR
jgi:hypothetical protein